MNRRLLLIMTRPSDDGFDAYVNFREKTTLKSKQNQKGLTKDELIAEWEKFWRRLNSKPRRKVCSVNFHS